MLFMSLIWQDHKNRLLYSYKVNSYDIFKAAPENYIYQKYSLLYKIVAPCYAIRYTVALVKDLALAIFVGMPKSFFDKGRSFKVYSFCAIRDFQQVLASVTMIFFTVYSIYYIKIAKEHKERYHDVAKKRDGSVPPQPAATHHPVDAPHIPQPERFKERDLAKIPLSEFNQNPPTLDEIKYVRQELKSSTSFNVLGGEIKTLGDVFSFPRLNMNVETLNKLFKLNKNAVAFLDPQKVKEVVEIEFKKSYFVEYPFYALISNEQLEILDSSLWSKKIVEALCPDSSNKERFNALSLAQVSVAFIPIFQVFPKCWATDEHLKNFDLKGLGERLKKAKIDNFDGGYLVHFLNSEDVNEYKRRFALLNPAAVAKAFDDGAVGSNARYNLLQHMSKEQIACLKSEEHLKYFADYLFQKDDPDLEERFGCLKEHLVRALYKYSCCPQYLKILALKRYPDLSNSQ